MRRLWCCAVAFLTAGLLPGGVLAQSGIGLNEVYSRGTNENPDWIELYNADVQPVDVTGFKIYDNAGKAGTKPKKEFAPGSVVPALGVLVVVTEDGTASAFGLSSHGETVWLEDATGTVIDSVAFPALAKTESYARYPDGGAWKTVARVTRGALNGAIRMNEIYSRGTSADPDWIEVYNDLPDSVDLTGYKIYDKAGQAGTKPKKEFPAVTKIPGKSVFVIVTDNTGVASDFGLSTGGEKVWLEDPTGVVIDSVAFPAMETSQSYSRVPDGGPWQLVSTITRGTSNGSPVKVWDRPPAPHEYRLGQNYPNPFNPTTYIALHLPKPTHVNLSVFNVIGQKVMALVDGEMSAGDHQLAVDGSQLPSGVYLYMLRTRDYTATRRMVLLK